MFDCDKCKEEEAVVMDQDCFRCEECGAIFQIDRDYDYRGDRYVDCSTPGKPIES
jgi:hypothetical protein